MTIRCGTCRWPWSADHDCTPWRHFAVSVDSRGARLLARGDGR